jgi:hypothetical protein
MKRGTNFLVIAVVSVLFLFVLLFSCSKSLPNGPLGVNKLQPTPTQTPTPDSPYTIFLNQEGTPDAGVKVVLSQPTAGITLTGTTDSKGVVVLNVHKGGQWILDVDTFSGYEGQKFTVEPLSNTYNSLNYGLPSLEVKLKSGSEMIPLHASVIEYEVIYHTKYPRPAIINHNFPGKITALGNNISIRTDGDSDIFTAKIPNSFEDYTGYNIDKKQTLDFKFLCTSNIGSYIVNSQTRTITKDWYIELHVDVLYAAYKDYVYFYGRTIYYFGIKNENLIYYGNAKPGSDRKFKIVSARNIGSAGSGSWIDTLTAMPQYGIFDTVAQILTNVDETYAYDHSDNDGEIVLHITDGEDLDIYRTLKTSAAWSNPCFLWCCTSKDISPQTYGCTSGGAPDGHCGLWDYMRIAYAWKEKSESFIIIQ